MNTPSERLMYALGKRTMKPADLGRARGVGRANAYLLARGKTDPHLSTADTVAAVCRAVRINRDWWLDGRGPMDASEARTQDDRIDHIRALLEEVRAAQVALVKALAEDAPDVRGSLMEHLEVSSTALGGNAYLQALKDVLQGAESQTRLLPGPSREERRE